MKKSEAVFHLRVLMRVVQRFRSILDEQGIISDRVDIDNLHFTQEQAGTVWPWVWGKKCILPILSKMLDKFDDTGELDPMAFYNVITIATKLEPMLGFGASVMNDPNFPEQPELSWIRGWDKE